MQTHPRQALQDNPFDLRYPAAYERWRDQKLDGYPTDLSQLIVEVDDPRALTRTEHGQLARLCRKTNMAIYSGNTGDDPDREVVRGLGRQFGLHRLDHNMCADDDAITALQVGSDSLHQGYIPYTTRPIAWHTDGYYNPLNRQIRAMVLHCVTPAETGGENQLLDPEIAYILLREENPEYIESLSQPDVMTIPANVVEGKELRPPQSGPVFSVFPDGALHMRYTARTRSIEWKQNPATERAVAFLVQILSQPSTYRFRGLLQSGQGLLCNNVLHTRTGFENGRRQRLLYRARYYDRLKLD